MKSTLGSADRYDRDIDGLTDDPLSRIAARISPGETVLDVGCSTGLLGRSLTTKRCISDGIDLDPEAADRASAFYRNVIVANLESAHLLDYFMQRGYDCIVCADVLEHLRSPENLLRQFRDLLKPGGRIFLSIPNIAYAGVIAELIGGEFEYRPNGLLDETHLRFFTRNSLLRMIAQEGYGVACIDTIRRKIHLSEFRQTYAAQLSPSMAETIYAQADALTYQFIIELSLEERSTLEGQHVPQSLSRPRFGVQLFWSFDQFNYDETNSLRESAMLGQDPQTLVFRLPDLPQQPFSLRIDPGDREGVVRFYSLKLKTNKGRVIRRFGLDELFSVAVCHQAEICPELFGDNILLTGEDPHLILSGEHCFKSDPGRLSVVELVIGFVQMPDLQTWASKTKTLVSEITQRAATERDAAVAERDGQIGSLNQGVAERDGQIASLTQAVAERDGQINALNRSVAERDGRIASLNESVAERDGQIASLNQAVAKRDRQIAGLTQAVAERDGRIASLAQALAERDGRIASLNRSVTKRDGQIDRLNQAMAGRDRRIAKLVEAVAKRDVMPHAMRSSTSWRVTAPLRFVKSAASSLHPRRRLRKAVSITATSLYRALPLSVGRKMKLKGWLFSAFPFLFRHSAAYRNWLVSVGRQPAPAHVVSKKTQTAPLAYPATEIVHETCPPSVTKYLDDLFVRAQGNPGGSLTYVPLATDSLDADRLDVKLIAFYLPQYHPIPENDQWWGKGFTEWTNVSKTMPQFVGHYQPRLPGELGFYDLRVPDVQRRQIELAKTYGIYGFCYHHYWFAGKRLLDTPFNQVLASPDLDLPFCLCWANENWTRRWDGLEEEVLIAQGYSEEDDLAFIRDIEPALRDRRYIRIDGRLLLIVYRVSQLPDARATANRWRTYCEQNGIGDLFLVAARSFDITDPRPYGFDAAVQFPPHQVSVPKINNEMAIVNSAYSGNIYDYRQMARANAEMEVDGYPMFRCVMPGWDNEARQPGKGHIFAHSSPGAYAEWLDQACLAATRTPRSQRLVFVNAWNEWGEGAYLEPDRMYGYAYLHATTNVLRGYVRSGNAAELAAESRHAFRKKSDVAVVLHLYYEDLLSELSDSFLINVQTSDLFVTVRPDVSEETIRDLLERFPNAYVSIAQNRGRDILPFLSMLTLVSTLGYEVGCKIHTKKSTNRSDGTSIRTRLVGELIGTRDRVDRILSSFRADPNLGMVVPQGSRLSLVEECRNILNRKWLNEMLPRLGRSEEIDLYRFHFPAGSMFWFRPAALNPLMQLRLQPDHFERELGQRDGTLAHTIERLFELSAEVAGYRVTDTRSVGAPCETPDMRIGG